MTNHPFRHTAGFTLIEIMVVVVILGILAALVVPNIIGKPDEARIVKARQDIRALEGALNLYRLENFRYPSAQHSLQALVERPNDPSVKNYPKGGYLAKKTVPKDPWGNEYLYENPGQHGEIDIFSYGADGQPGGEGVDADIGNWDLD